MYTLHSCESTKKKTRDYSKPKTNVTKYKFVPVTAICVVFDFSLKGKTTSKQTKKLKITDHLNFYGITIKVANIHSCENDTVMLQLS